MWMWMWMWEAGILKRIYSQGKGKQAVPLIAIKWLPRPQHLLTNPITSPLLRPDSGGMRLLVHLRGFCGRPAF